VAMVNATALADFADNVLVDVEIPELPRHYRGKVRDNYDLPDGRRLIVASDRLSAFDINLAAIPLKGQVLTQTARFWFEATRDICPNHVIDYPDPNVVLCRTLDILPVEVVVRDYLAGTTGTSVLSLYRAGQRDMYGLRLPDGLRPNEKLPVTIVTPTSKAFHGGHDEPLSPAEIVGRNLLSAERWREVSEHALALFARGRDMARERGLILVDTKYEFGLDRDGRVVLADEIHTPDSSRYWFLDSYQSRFEAGERPESFDKDFVRNWVASRCDPYKEPVPEIPQDVILETAAVYVRAFETITAKPFAWPDPDVPVLERIRANLAAFF
jgi:phosphoribosylaminoimidazole-succinocarboxamide synthase